MLTQISVTIYDVTSRQWVNVALLLGFGRKSNWHSTTPHDDVITSFKASWWRHDILQRLMMTLCKRFPCCYWPFVKGTCRSSVDCSHNNPVMLGIHVYFVMFVINLTCCWTNNRVVCKLRRCGAHVTGRHCNLSYNLSSQCEKLLSPVSTTVLAGPCTHLKIQDLLIQLQLLLEGIHLLPAPEI